MDATVGFPLNAPCEECDYDLVVAWTVAAIDGDHVLCLDCARWLYDLQGEDGSSYPSDVFVRPRPP